MQGWRTGHEDAHDIRCGEKGGAFWVLDGHGGDSAANLGAPMLGAEFAEMVFAGKLPEDKRIEDGLIDVDQKIRDHFKSNPDQESGSTVVGALAVLAADGTYTVKLVNCGDSRAIIFAGPEDEPTPAAKLSVPQHLLDLVTSPADVEKGNAAKTCEWPLIQETIDHKPSHPTEKSRIVAAGGHVTEDDPPRLDGNLAVSRSLGDFQYKADEDAAPAAQKVSCIPDIYQVQGLRRGTFCVLCCDGVWDVLSAEDVCELVLEAVKADPAADLGSIAAKIVETSLDKNSRDNVTAMVMQMKECPDWLENPPQDEMKCFDKLLDTTLDEEVKKQSLAFLKRAQFSSEPCVCDVCSRWFLSMQQCPCKTVHYCNKACQKKGWKKHKPFCPTVTNSPATGQKKK